MKILIIEDEKQLAESVCRYLSSVNHKPEIVNSCFEAEDRLSINSYDIILLDITLPDGSGLKLIPLIRKMDKRCGIIIISAKDSTDDKVEGLDLGADDYLTKPFHLAELNSRIGSLSRRRFFDNSDKIVFKEIEIINESAEVKVNGQNIELTRKEYEILLYFIINREKVITRESLAEHIWGDLAGNYDNFDFIYNHVKNIRKKIEQKNGRNYLHNIYGIGYKFCEK